MKRGRFCFVAWCFAAALWLLTGPLTLADVVAPGSQASATYLGVDTTTSGDWIGHYGSEGHIIPGASTNLPNYVQLRVTADIANDACSDSRCLETSDRLSRTRNSCSERSQSLRVATQCPGSCSSLRRQSDAFRWCDASQDPRNLDR